MKNYYTTSEAAKFLSVSSDTVLKWVKAGKIRSYRTPGGHCRIPAEAVAALLPSGAAVLDAEGREEPGNSFLYCWDYYGGPEGIGPECRNCVAYKSRARRCYEMRDIPEEFGPLKLFCQSDCQDCEFFQLTHAQEQSVLVVSRNRRWLESLALEAENTPLQLDFASSEYECGAAIASFRPDFIVVDLSLGPRRTQEICRQLTADQRIPFTRIILTSRQASWAEDCNQEVFGWLQKQFTIEQLQDFIRGATRVAEPA